jgi:hypothetical protein
MMILQQVRFRLWDGLLPGVLEIVLTVCPLTVKIIVGLIRKLNLTESVFETLTPIETKREVETYSLALRDTTVSESTAAGVMLVHWCSDVGMVVCHVVT